MGKVCGLFLLGIFATLAFVGFKTYSILYHVPQLPKMEDTWWGPRDPTKEDTSIKPFKINVSDQLLEDLKHRLDISKPFVPPLENVAHNYGINTKLLNEIITYWKTTYNWKQREAFLNKYPQYIVSIQGLKIHYIHVKPTNTAGKKVLPLILFHGWPGSVREFYEIIPLLTKPQKDYVFELIIPSLPGYGFSEGAVRPGMGGAHMAVIFKNLMDRLGFKKYYVHGGDWGGLIVQVMATMYPDKVIGVHSNACFVNSPLANFITILGSFAPSLVAEKHEIDKVYPMTNKFMYLIEESGYMHIQGTKPDTIGAALRDSPVGLAAYILEKFITWTNPSFKNQLDGGLKLKYDFDKLLDNVMIYWVSDSITTSVRLYSESLSSTHMSLGLENIPVKVPSGCARFAHDLFYSSKTVLETKYHNLIHVTDYEGGHFAALELPGTLAKDIFTFVNKVEKLPKGTQKQEL